VSETPPITVVIPVRDCERYIGEALDSILAQTIPVAQIIVVDDGSTDETREVVRRHGAAAELIVQEPLGIGAATNRGIAAARGELLSFLDADDLWSPQKVEIQLAARKRDPGIDLCFGHVEQFISPELTERDRSELRAPGKPTPGRVKGTMLVSRRSFDRVGEFNTELRLGEFIDWCLRAREAELREEVLPEVLMRRRIHGANTGRERRDDRQDYAKVVGQALRRRAREQR
jgi:glycosyltransferase involved in cell wall biosynthesis